MVFYFFIFIVFTAELIIAATILISFFCWSKKINNANIFLNEAKPKIQEIVQTSRKISDQLSELAPIWVEDIKDKVSDIILEQAKNFLTGILAFFVSKQIENFIVEKVNN